MNPAYRIERLTSDHDRTSFDCGVPTLNRYFREQAGQDVRRRLSNCYVATDREGTVVAFYTFAAGSVPCAELPPDIVRKMPRYPMFPAGLVGRLAVARRVQGDGLGGDLIVDAIGRAARAEPAIFTLLVDAKDEVAGRFYVKHGFSPLTTRRLSFFLTLGRAAEMLVE